MELESRSVTLHLILQLRVGTTSERRGLPDANAGTLVEHV